MATLDDLDKARQKVKEAADLYKKFEELKIPDSLKKAVEEDWVLRQGLVDFGMKLEYDHDEKRPDKMRAVRARAVIVVLQDLEADLVDQAVVTPTEGIWRYVHFIETVAKLLIDNGKLIYDALWQLIKLLLNAIWSAIKELFFNPSGAVNSVISAFKSAWTVLISCSVVMLVSIIKAYVKSFGTPSLVRTVRAALKSRNKAVAALRKKTLPQGSGPRYFRRKETVTK